MPSRNRRPSATQKRKAAPPAAPTAAPPINGSPHPPSVPGLPQHGFTIGRTDGLALLGCAHEGPPATPHTTRLLIVRAPGGYTLFDADGIELTQADANPANAIGVASTGDDLVRRIRDWVAAQPAVEISL